MAVKINIGGSWKDVSSIHIMPAKGGSWKEVQKGMIAPVKGLINKLFYEGKQWVLKTGEICKSIYGEVMLNYGQKRTHSSVSAGEIIRPVSIKMDITARRGEADTNPKLRCTCYYSTNNVDWTALPYQEKTISTTYEYIYAYSFSMNGNTDVKYLKFELEHKTSGGAYIVLKSSTGKCTSWYQWE